MKVEYYWALIISILSVLLFVTCSSSSPVSQPNVTGPNSGGSASGNQGSASSGSSSTTTPAQTPKIIAGATIPQTKINFNQLFDLGIIVFNTGNGIAQNVHLYCRANPGGLIVVQNVDRPSSPLAPSGVNVTLGDIYPGQQQNVNFKLRAPSQAQIGGLRGQNFEINFAADYYNGQQSQVGNITFSVGQGTMMMIEPHGFGK